MIELIEVSLRKIHMKLVLTYILFVINKKLLISRRINMSLWMLQLQEFPRKYKNSFVERTRKQTTMKLTKLMPLQEVLPNLHKSFLKFISLLLHHFQKWTLMVTCCLNLKEISLNDLENPLLTNRIGHPLILKKWVLQGSQKSLKVHALNFTNKKFQLRTVEKFNFLLVVNQKKMEMAPLHLDNIK